ncbi:unnamed protein product [Closterium sp. NIES-53]
MVDGTKLPIHGKSTLQLQIGALRWKPTLPITNIKGLDFILGRDFLKRFNPEIDWVNQKTCIYNNGKRVELRSWTDTGSVPETTLARFERTVNESNTGYLALVMAAAEEEVLEQYKDLIPDHLPAGVPPARTHEHEIVEEPGAKPVSRAPYRLRKIWVPNYAPLRHILLEEFHDVPYAGHFGSNKTLAGIAKYYYWPRMAADVQQFVTSCDTCQRMKSSKQKKKKQGYFSLYPYRSNHGRSLASTSSQDFLRPHGATARLFFDRIITIHGIPATLISDRDPKFTIGDQVLLDTRNLNLSHLPSKLRPRFCGPFLVEAQVTPVTFRLRLLDTWKLHNAFHVQLLKPYKDPNQQFQGRQLPPPPPVLVQDKPEYEVEHVLTHRRRGGKTLEFLLRWKGYDPTEDSWVVEADTGNARRPLKDYLVKQGVSHATQL